MPPAVSGSRRPLATLTTLRLDSGRCAPTVGTEYEPEACHALYASFRINRPGGGTSCGASYHLPAPALGAACAIRVTGEALHWASDGIRCEVLVDEGELLHQGACAGSTPLLADLQQAGRHQARLRVTASPLGQTACSTVFHR